MAAEVKTNEAQLGEISFEGTKTIAMIYNDFHVIDYLYYIPKYLVASAMNSKKMKAYMGHNTCTQIFFLKSVIKSFKCWVAVFLGGEIRFCILLHLH
jgi:hypothetical protein